MEKFAKRFVAKKGWSVPFHKEKFEKRAFILKELAEYTFFKEKIYKRTFL